jgi:hypothetical protein
MDEPKDLLADFLKQRLETISKGMKEGIRREVEMRRKLGLPIHISRDGKVVDISNEIQIEELPNA